MMDLKIPVDFGVNGSAQCNLIILSILLFLTLIYIFIYSLLSVCLFLFWYSTIQDLLDLPGCFLIFFLFFDVVSMFLWMLKLCWNPVSCAKTQLKSLSMTTEFNRLIESTNQISTEFSNLSKCILFMMLKK